MEITVNLPTKVTLSEEDMKGVTTEYLRRKLDIRLSDKDFPYLEGEHPHETGGLGELWFLGLRHAKGYQTGQSYPNRLTRPKISTR